MIVQPQLFKWLIFLYALVGRLLDIISTKRVTPGLQLESNFFVKKFGWTYAWFTVLIALFAFSDPGFGIIIGTFSCFAAFSNMRNALIARSLGEVEFKALYLRAWSSTSKKDRLINTSLNYFPLLLISAVQWSLSVLSRNGYIADVALGILSYVIAMLFWGGVYKKRNT